MQPFDFASAHDERAALAAQKKSEHSRFLAGGTNLVDLMKLHVEVPDQLVDISALAWKSVREQSRGSLHPQGLAAPASSIHIGALVTNTDLAHHPLITKHLPVLSEAILSGASVQLRNLATTGGNLLQRTRCPYFRDTACACNKRQPGSGCAAIGGIHRNLAILGISDACIASNPSDMNVALMALDAVIHIKGTAHDRQVPIVDFYRLPEQTPQIETVLQKDEIITAVEVPRHAWFQKSVYVKVRDRASYAFALTSAAVALDLHGGNVRDVRIALGGVGSIPWRAKAAEEALRGQAFNRAQIEKAAATALTGAKPRPGNQFKVQLAQRTLVNALMKCGGLT